MNIGEIDKDFRELIKYLNDKDFKPFASCDGVDANHTPGNMPDLAYISFLKSSKIIDLMAAFLRDKETFTISLTSHTTHQQENLYGNIIEGNQYAIYFSNHSAEKTSYFEKIIKGIVEDKIQIKDSERAQLLELDSVLEDENTDLYFDVEFNSRYQPIMQKEGKTYKLTIGIKEGIQIDETLPENTICIENINELLNKISEKFEIPIKRLLVDNNFEEDKFAFSFSKINCEIYFGEDDWDEIIKTIRYAKQIEKEVPLIEVIKEDSKEYQELIDDIEK